MQKKPNTIIICISTLLVFEYLASYVNIQTNHALVPHSEVAINFYLLHWVNPIAS